METIPRGPHAIAQRPSVVSKRVYPCMLLERTSGAGCERGCDQAASSPATGAVSADSGTFAAAWTAASTVLVLGRRRPLGFGASTVFFVAARRRVADATA